MVVAGVFSLALGVLQTSAHAEDSHVASPAILVPAVVKAADYDRHFSARANGHVRTLVIFRDGDPGSENSAHEFAALLSKTGKIAGLAHEEHAAPYAGANAVAAEIRAEQTAILVLAPGLGDEAPALAHELDGIDVLSVAMDLDDVSKGIVFGVDTRAGKSTLVIRLAQARRQNVAFEASLLKLARIE